jgi:N-methylhydantoinase B/oxoprolinase/acetone carboxylase alpha subunit
VERDVHNGYVSIKKAKEDYGVSIDPESLALDMDATLKLRENK